MAFKIAYGAGHGLHTAGKRTPDGEREWTFNNKVLLAFEDEIKKYEGVQLLRTDDPTGQRDVPLRERTNKANNWKADIYISFHHNALTGKWHNGGGTETFYHKGSSNGKRLAQLVQDAQLRAYGLKSRGIKTNNLHVTRETKMPAVLSEGGFMDSRIDIKKMRNDSVLKQAGINIARAVAEYAGLKEVKIMNDKPSDWASKAWDWAVKQGLVTSDPKDNMTREQGITILHSYHTMNSGGQPSEWAKSSWDWAQEQGYMNGKNPKADITRQELAAVLKSFADKNNLK